MTKLSEKPKGSVSSAVCVCVCVCGWGGVGGGWGGGFGPTNSRAKKGKLPLTHTSREWITHQEAAKPAEEESSEGCRSVIFIIAFLA